MGGFRGRRGALCGEVPVKLSVLSTAANLWRKSTPNSARAAPSCSASAFPMEIICALLTYSRDTARRDCTISFARTLQVAMSLRLAASVMDLRTFFSSNWMSEEGA